MMHVGEVGFAGIGPAAHPASRVSRARLRLYGVGGALACRASTPVFP
jgi:hypothetical protein